MNRTARTTRAMLELCGHDSKEIEELPKEQGELKGKQTELTARKIRIQQKRVVGSELMALY